MAILPLIPDRGRPGLGGLLSGLMDDPDRKEALQRALIMAGAGMASAGPGVPLGTVLARGLASGGMSWMDSKGDMRQAAAKRADQEDYRQTIQALSRRDEPQMGAVAPVQVSAKSLALPEDIKGRGTRAMEILQKAGLAPHMAAGIVGNLVQESNLDTGAVGDKGTAFGVAQWRGERLNRLKRFAASRGKDWRDFDTQIEFIPIEMQQHETGAWKRMQSAKDAREAAFAMAGYERPQGWKGWDRTDPAGIHGWGNRLGHAMAFAGGDSGPLNMGADPSPVLGQQPVRMADASGALPMPRQGFSLSPEQAAILGSLSPDEGRKRLAEWMKPESDPTSIREYAFDMQQRQALGMPAISREQWAAERAEAQRPQNNINIGQSEYGTIPPGYQLVRDPETGGLSMAPIPGGPVAREIEDMEAKARQRQQNISMAGGTVVQDLGRGLELLENSDWAAGPTATVSSRIPGTPAYQLNQFVQSVASNIGVDRLQAMREASPTGGALGQVPFQQQQRLEQLLGSLDITQPKEVLAANMKRISNIYMDLIHGTPQNVAAAVAEGRIPAEQAIPLMQRFDLPFDEMGRSVPAVEQAPPTGNLLEKARAAIAAGADRAAVIERLRALGVDPVGL